MLYRLRRRSNTIFYVAFNVVWHTSMTKATARKKLSLKGAAKDGIVREKIGRLLEQSQGKRSPFLSRLVKPGRSEQIAAGNLFKRGAIEIIDRKGGTAEIVAPAQRADAKDTGRDESSVAHDSGLKLLRKAVRDQSHMRKLPQHERQDYEFQLRRVATTGIVRLFNALAAANQAGAVQFAETEKTQTIDKAEEKKFVATRDAFLNSLRSSQPTSARL